VTDLTPTFLDYAKVSHPTTYNGHPVHPLMGKSIRPLLNGTADRIHGINEAIGSEMFNSSALFMDDWVAVSDGAHPTGKWQLYNIVNDPAENNNVADQHPDVVQKMAAAYQNYSKDVGIVIPRGQLFAFQVAHLTPSLDQPQTIQMVGILPEQLKIVKELLTNGTFAAES
jgi:arylsulfatase